MAATMPRVRIELTTPASSGLRSTTELPRRVVSILKQVLGNDGLLLRPHCHCDFFFLIFIVAKNAQKSNSPAKSGTIEALYKERTKLI